MAQDIRSMGRFREGAQPAAMAGLELLYSAVARKLFVVVEGRAVPLEAATVVLVLQQGLLEVQPEAREELARVLRGDDGTAGLRARDGYLPAPEDLGVDEPELLLLLRNLGTARESDIVLAQEHAGEPWCSHVTGVALLSAGRFEEAAVHLRAAYEEDPLDLKALNYYLLARSAEHRVLAARLPLLLHLEASVATPESAAIDEILHRDLSGYPPVSSGWHLVNLATTAVTLLLLLAVVVMALLSPAAAGY